ncbi:MAG: hypothetical protein KatS3mg015_1934 [Fimbriimonadales bacterium]|nr:MAG: hypothetical protein KatS3mg015_1934 [Fimbriimonadales bacterium]
MFGHNVAAMTEFAEVWLFTRERLAGAWEDLDDRQLRWRPWRDAHSIAQMLAHVAGSEHYLGCRILGRDPHTTPEDQRLDRAVIASFIEEQEPFPFSDEELTKSFLSRLLDRSAAIAREAIANPTMEQLQREFRSPLGPTITGRQALWRMAQHAAYHTGQIWIYRMSPEFPPASD